MRSASFNCFAASAVSLKGKTRRFSNSSVYRHPQSSTGSTAHSLGPLCHSLSFCRLTPSKTSRRPRIQPGHDAPTSAASADAAARHYQQDPGLVQVTTASVLDDWACAGSSTAVAQARPRNRRQRGNLLQTAWLRRATRGEVMAGRPRHGARRGIARGNQHYSGG